MFAVTPTREQFRDLARQGNVVPITKAALADMETPVSAFRRLVGRPNAFLLESVEGGERMARYSFLGAEPRAVIRSKNGIVTVQEDGQTRTVALAPGQDPLHILQQRLDRVRYVPRPGLPRFVGGAVGSIAYDWVRFLEPIDDRTVDDLAVDDVHLLIVDDLLVFDHVQHRLIALANAHIPDDADDDALERVYDDAVERIERLLAALRAPLPLPTTPTTAPSVKPWISQIPRVRFTEMVLAAKEYIAAGDIIQAVLSQRFSRPLDADPFDVYRALRSLNPSPYMYYLAFDDGPTIVGASPERLCTVEDGRVTVRPIAGTRPRSDDPTTDDALAEELLADEKERAEHIMLVDLGRNDIGRVCAYGTVAVSELMVVERYSHVMHIVSNVHGTLRPDVSPLDALRATFPAGTLSGAPKVRAMQIIEELEPTRRGIYGGAIGYFSYDGNVDSCITIRTLVIKDGVAHVQAGAGIVADSQPDAEFQETVNKSAAPRRAVALAEAGLDHAPNAVLSRFQNLDISVETVAQRNVP
jgi:anthranilate synthase component 1